MHQGVIKNFLSELRKAYELISPEQSNILYIMIIQSENRLPSLYLHVILQLVLAKSLEINLKKFLMIETFLVITSFKGWGSKVKWLQLDSNPEPLSS